MIEANVKLIRVRMAELDLTRQEVAEQAGITDMTLRRIMRGGDMKLTTLASIARVLEIHPDEILIVNGNREHEGERVMA